MDDHKLLQTTEVEFSCIAAKQGAHILLTSYI